MTLHFFKYQATGNDFIIADNRNKNLNLSEKQIAVMCHRKFGIGADGLILFENIAEYDFKMTYYNSNGKESSMCGNGARCTAAFANMLGIVKNKTRFSACDGEHYADITSLEGNNAMVSLKMQDVKEYKTFGEDIFLNTGSPHYVRFVSNYNDMDVVEEGKKLRYNIDISKSGTNVDFVKTEANHLFVRTYERGVENETLSCGTGVVASALAASVKNKDSMNPCNIKTLGGDLTVKFKNDGGKFHDIWLEGLASLVFKGEINI